MTGSTPKSYWCILCDEFGVTITSFSHVFFKTHVLWWLFNRLAFYEIALIMYYFYVYVMLCLRCRIWIVISVLIYCTVLVVCIWFLFSMLLELRLYYSKIRGLVYAHIFIGLFFFPCISFDFLTIACGSCQQLRWDDRTTILSMHWIFIWVLFLLSLCLSSYLIHNICFTQLHLYILNVHVFIFMCMYTYRLCYDVFDFILLCLLTFDYSLSFYWLHLFYY
jgi:hypothetical protein